MPLLEIVENRTCSATAAPSWPRRGGVALLAINPSRTQAASIEVAACAERYTLTARKLEDCAIR
jgi:hypothetical protein